MILPHRTSMQQTEDRALLRSEQEEAYDAALLEDVMRESLEEYQREGGSLCTVGSTSEGDKVCGGGTACEGGSVCEDGSAARADSPVEEAADAPLSPASLRAARLLRFAPPVKPAKRRRRSEIAILTGVAPSSNQPPSTRRTRSGQ